MTKDQDRFSYAFCFILNTGKEIYPIKVKRQKTGNIAFRISAGGKGGNIVAASEEVDEETMIHKVLNEGYAVRCSSLDRAIFGLYKHGNRSVKNVRRGPNENQNYIVNS